MHSYRIAGLTVSSEIPLPGARVADAAPMPDVVMRKTDVPQKLDHITASMPAWETDGQRFLMRAPGIGRFLLTGGRDVGFQAEAGADVSDCAIYLLGTVFGILLHQRGQIALHASAVAVGGKAILFCGRSGLGKSTLAAALCRRGYPLISDDICAIAFNAEGYPRVSADSRQLKLASDAIDALGLERYKGGAVRRGMEKYYVEPPLCADAADLPVVGVYVLRRGAEPRAAGPEETSVAEALRLLQRNAYRPGIVKRTGQIPRYFEAAAAIASKAKVFRLVPGHDLARLPETIALLERHWLENGLLQSTK